MKYKHRIFTLLISALPLLNAVSSPLPLGEGAGEGLILEHGTLYGEGIIPSCHASTIVELPNGDMLAAYFAGTYEGHPDCCIYMSRRRAGHTTWDRPQLLVSGIRTASTESAFSYDDPAEGTDPAGIDDFTKNTRKRKPCYNPVLYMLPGSQPQLKSSARFDQSMVKRSEAKLVGPPGSAEAIKQQTIVPTLVLDYKLGKFVQDWTGWEVRSTDGGYTWTQPRPLQTDSALHQIQLGPIKNKPVVIPMMQPDGRTPRVFPGGGVRSHRIGGAPQTPYRLLAGSSTETGGDWKFHFEYSDDGGKTWTLTYPERDTLQCIQPSILFLKDGRLKAIGRTRHGRLAQCYSSDYGTTWSEVTLSDMPNNNSGTDALTLRDGRHVLVYNDSNVEGRRTPLSVAISDDAEHWTKICDLETDDLGEYSYPSVIQASDGKLWVLYTWRRQQIGYAVIDIEK